MSENKINYETLGIFPELPTEETPQGKFYNLPTSAATDTIMKVLSVGKKGLPNLPEREKLSNPNREVKVFENGSKRQITVNSKKAEQSIEILNIDKLTGTNKQAKKMFIFFLIKINEQAFSRGVMRRNFIQFSLQELVDIGHYSTRKTARTGFIDAYNILHTFEVEGYYFKGKKQIKEESTSLFIKKEIDKTGVCTVWLNELVNWDFIEGFYTIIPKYCFSLSNRAFDLLYCISYIARQNVRQIEDRGYFTIGMRVIQERLNLPGEGNRNADRTIKQKVEGAIEDIENKNNNDDLTIDLMGYTEGDPISTYFNNAYLKIGLKGEYAESFINLSKNTAKQVESARKRKENIEDRAKEKYMAEKIAAEEKEKEKNEE